MAKEYHNAKFKNKTTSPERAGKQNLEKHLDSLPKDDAGLNEKLMYARNKGKDNFQAFKGKWTDEQLEESIDEFFQYCLETDLKPTQPLIRMWLSISKTQFADWRTKPDKYGYKSVLIKNALELMECYLQGNIDKYPTGNIFLLKTMFGHIEANKLDITTNNKDITNADDVKNLVSKLGLDKKSE